MRIFMSYASEQKSVAEAIAYSLRSRGHRVFLDRDDLPEGESYDEKIATAVDRSDLMIFLISPDSVAEGRYTLTELRYARYKWRNPSGRVLPVMLEPTPIGTVPPYLKSVSILEPHGNKAAEVTFAVERLSGVGRAVNAAALAGLAGVGVAIVAGFMPILANQSRWRWLEALIPSFTSILIVILLGAFLATLYWTLGDRRWWKVSLIGLSALAAWIACLAVFFGVGNNAQPFAGPPTSEFSRIVDALDPGKTAGLAKETEAVRRFLDGWSGTSQAWGAAFTLGLAGLGCFTTIFAAFAVLERSMRNLNRLVIGAFLALIAGATGHLLAHYSGVTSSDKKLFWFVEYVDVYFALMYLPWLVMIPAALAFWLVRGQER